MQTMNDYVDSVMLDVYCVDRYCREMSDVLTLLLTVQLDWPDNAILDKTVDMLFDFWTVKLAKHGLRLKHYFDGDVFKFRVEEIDDGH